MAVVQFSFAQSSAEQKINAAFVEFKQNPATFIEKYASEDYYFITAEGRFMNKTQNIQLVSGAKLDEMTLSERNYKMIGEIVIFSGINQSKWSMGTNSINYKDAFTYVLSIKGNDIKWLSAQHSLLTPKDRNKALYREINKLANEGKIVEVSKYYADSHEIKGIGKGPKATEILNQNYLKTFPDLQVRIIELIAEGDLVMARCEATGTQKGEMSGIPPTGKTGKVAHWTINRFNEEGKITESWNLNDNLSMMQQLGIIK
jgi:predicted ester cyclase